MTRAQPHRERRSRPIHDSRGRGPTEGTRSAPQRGHQASVRRNEASRCHGFHDTMAPWPRIYRRSREARTGFIREWLYKIKDYSSTDEWFSRNPVHALLRPKEGSNQMVVVMAMSLAEAGRENCCSPLAERGKVDGVQQKTCLPWRRRQMSHSVVRATWVQGERSQMRGFYVASPIEITSGSVGVR